MATKRVTASGPSSARSSSSSAAFRVASSDRPNGGAASPRSARSSQRSYHCATARTCRARSLAVQSPQATRLQPPGPSAPAAATKASTPSSYRRSTVPRGTPGIAPEANPRESRPRDDRAAESGPSARHTRDRGLAGVQGRRSHRRHVRRGVPGLHLHGQHLRRSVRRQPRHDEQTMKRTAGSVTFARLVATQSPCRSDYSTPVATATPTAMRMTPPTRSPQAPRCGPTRRPSSNPANVKPTLTTPMTAAAANTFT